MTERRSGEGPIPGGDTFGVDLASLTEEILPALIARLRASRLGELEIRSDAWRVRLRRDLRTRRPGRGQATDGLRTDADDDEPRPGEARSPAVGYFNPARQLVVGQAVLAGDTLGSVDMLGIDQDVTAPIGGIVSAILAERGQAVEYGQVLIEIDALGDDEAPSTFREAEGAA